MTSITKSATNVGAIFGLALAVAMLAPILGTLVGMWSGLVVGFFFESVFAEVLTPFWFSGIALWKLGGVIGFIGTVLKGANVDFKQPN